MRDIRKGLFITGAIMVMGLGLTGCTKVQENAEGSDGSVVEAEDLPAPENPEENMEGEEGGKGEDPADDLSSLRYVPDTEGDLYGDICEVGDGQFTVTEIYTETFDDGSGIMIMGAPGVETESAKITVVYDENTVFEKQKIWDGGANHEEKEGSAADLQKGFTAEMWGSYEGDVFHATAIKVVEVIL